MPRRSEIVLFKNKRTMHVMRCFVLVCAENGALLVINLTVVLPASVNHLPCSFPDRHLGCDLVERFILTSRTLYRKVYECIRSYGSSHLHPASIRPLLHRFSRYALILLPPSINAPPKHRACYQSSPFLQKWCRSTATNIACSTQALFFSSSRNPRAAPYVETGNKLRDKERKEGADRKQGKEEKAKRYCGSFGGGIWLLRLAGVVSFVCSLDTW
jgi:hypothetical protein